MTAQPCDGCGASAGEPCRWDCLSTVTDSEGQPAVTAPRVFQDPVTGTYWREDGRPGHACPDCGNGYATLAAVAAHDCAAEVES